MSDTEVVVVVESKPVMSKEQALSWVWSARLIIAAILVFTGLGSLLDILLGDNKPGLRYGVFDGAFAAVCFSLAFYVNKNLKKAYTTLK